LFFFLGNAGSGCQNPKSAVVVVFFGFLVSGHKSWQAHCISCFDLPRNEGGHLWPFW